MGGFDAAGLEAAQAPLKAVIASGDISGAVTLIWRDGEIIDVACLGQRDIARGLPMTRDTLFRIASMTKPVTTVAALMLMEEGRFKLEDPITPWAPEFADMRVLKDPAGPVEDTYTAPREITFEDLMTHRAGLAYAFSSVGPIAHAHQKALGDVLASPQDSDAWMAALAGLPLTYPPGERFHYSHATDVLGFVAARVAGTDIRTLMKTRIFDPLGMSDTDFFTPPAKRDRQAVVYRLDEKADRLDVVGFPVHDVPPAFCGGGGGLVSTADDYLKFARMLLNDGEVDGVRLLNPETVRLMRTNRLTPEQRAHTFMGMPFWLGQGFGLGLSVIDNPAANAWMGPGSEGAFTWPGAFGTWWQADPVNNMILIYLIQNAMPLGPEAVANMGQSERLGARLALPQWQFAVHAALKR
ncbi:MAG: beta-lactamase family protein, partial [Alphaproteobacteria bacterium]|nr:beta-lactamase family protein [Alphaproteobacteria bacterium]